MMEENFKLKLRGKTLAIIDWANVYGWSDSKSKECLGWEVNSQKLFEYLSSYPEIFDKRLYFGVDKGKQFSEELKQNFEKIGFNLQDKEVKWVPVSLEKSHFKKLIKELFDVLDNIKAANSEIAVRLYELRGKIEHRLLERKPDFDSDGGVQGEYPPYLPEDETIYNSAYELIEELDVELKKLNLNIDDLQKQMSIPVLRRKCDFDVEITRDVLNLLGNFEHLILFSGDGDYASLIEDIILNRNKNVIVVFAKGHKGKEYEKLIVKLTEKELKNRLFMCSVEKMKDFLVKNVIPEDFSPGRDN